jgi:hypothetical protein
MYAQLEQQFILEVFSRVVFPLSPALGTMPRRSDGLTQCLNHDDYQEALNNSWEVINSSDIMRNIAMPPDLSGSKVLHCQNASGK